MQEQSTEHTAWKTMIQRCYNSNDRNYSNYGYRGIRVCQQWLDSYENFLADMGRKPRFDYSLHRINNNGNYEPSNCKWASRQEQAKNKSYWERI